MDTPTIDRLLDEWAHETRHFSSMGQMMQHPHVSVLYGEGDAVAQRILARMTEGHVQIGWFPLLARTTKCNPVLPHHQGIVRLMVQDWLAWNKDRKATK